MHNHVYLMRKVVKELRERMGFDDDFDLVIKAEKSLDSLNLQTPSAELIDYILQDDIHNRLTPRVVDIAYSAFMIGRVGKNKDDGGPCDWYNDTKPMVMEQMEKIRRDLIEASGKEKTRD